MLSWEHGGGLIGVDLLTCFVTSLCDSLGQVHQQIEMEYSIAACFCCGVGSSGGCGSSDASSVPCNSMVQQHSIVMHGAACMQHRTAADLAAATWYMVTAQQVHQLCCCRATEAASDHAAAASAPALVQGAAVPAQQHSPSLQPAASV